MKTADVSIVIPALNEERYIERTLQSIAAQEFKGTYELIVSDGNSDDRTVEIARKYTSNIVIEPTRTIAAGRQTGTRIALGKIIAYTDADTTVPPDWLEHLTEQFKDPKVIAVTGKPLPLEHDIVSHLFSDFVMDPIARILCFFQIPYVYGGDMAIRKEVFDRIGGFNTSLVTAEDMDIINRAKKHGRVAYNPKAVAYFSMRRIKKWGYLKYLFFHIANFFKAELFDKPASKYEPVR